MRTKLKLRHREKPSSDRHWSRGLREERTQHAAKLQLTVRTRSRTHFFGAMSAKFLTAIIADFKL